MNKTPFDMQAGTTFNTKNCGDLLVVHYERASSVLVRFVNTGYERNAKSCHIRTGNVTDKNAPLTCGIGFVGIGKYKTKLGGKRTAEYARWHGMLSRCYSKSALKKQPSYVGCTVCVEWHNFQSFARWFNENNIEGFELDKDIKIKGNKVYSPLTCLFVSKSDNATMAKAKSYSMRSPRGDTTHIYNMKKFCNENNLSMKQMSKVNTGNAISHRGWSKC